MIRIALGLILAVLAIGGPARAADSYSFAVVPQFEPRKLFEIWKPILDAVSARAGVELRLTTTMTVHDFEHNLSAGNYDFAYTNPYQVLKERTGQGDQRPDEAREAPRPQRRRELQQAEEDEGGRQER
ncbi:MAG: PhnD/SsuA/transferrin family substrate-binding protein, partial [Actinomycetota bacterium]